MPLDHLPRPQWLTFDCYGTLIQWDEGLQAAVARILAANQGHSAPRRPRGSCVSTTSTNIGWSAPRPIGVSPTSRAKRCG